MSEREKAATVTLSAEIPAGLLAELEALVAKGWSRDLDDLVLEALRRHVESHRDSLMESFVREDVEWGLRGSD
jgi:hypothetical protein